MRSLVKIGQFPASFFFISAFTIQLSGFKLRIAGIGSDRSTNCAKLLH